MVLSGMFEREDWTDFRNLANLGRKAGVAIEKLPRLVLKELIDNALDAAGDCRFGRSRHDSFFVQDEGSGLAGTPEEIAALFSIKRPLRSSKHLRLPTRGALGNGLRVVVGAILSSGGALIVRTRKQSVRLAPQDDGSTKVVAVEPWDGVGTRVEIRFGSSLCKEDDDVFLWCRQAKALARRGAKYSGRSSPWWYDSDSFWDLLQGAGERTVRDLVAELEGCGRKKASEIAESFFNRSACELSRVEAERLLSRARQRSKPVRPARLGTVGRLPDYDGYAKEAGEFQVKPARGAVSGTIPFVVEAWAKLAAQPAITVCVNRTPITADVEVQRSSEEKVCYAIFGCNTGYRFKVGRSRDIAFLVNIQSPYMPLTTDGKEPDLHPLLSQLLAVLEGTARRAKKVPRASAHGLSARSQKAVIVEALPEAIERISGGHKTRYSLRQLFYAVRPRLLEVFGEEPKYKTFSRIITEYEDEQGEDLPGIYRDSRGVLYHPHEGRDIPLGTLHVEKYRRPRWTFNKILYCEKEGFFPLLKDAGWPERHDCALVTSKGYATRAARDVLDLLGESEEPLKFFCIHDADGPGTLIYDKLQNGTQARPGRKVKIINLGLEPDEALAMGLDVEPVKRENGQSVAVGSYVSERTAHWLQTHRVELNAMTTPQFLDWLDQKMTPHAGKLVPPVPVLVDRLAGEVRGQLKEAIVSRVLREAGVEGQVEAAYQILAPVVQEQGDNLEVHVRSELEAQPAELWSAPVYRLAADLVADGDQPT